MSYSLDQKCWSCKKQPDCLDGTILQIAVGAIHSLGSQKGHLGGGNITHTCTYGFEDRYAEAEQK